MLKQKTARSLALGLVTASLIGLVACGSDNGSSTQTNAIAPTTAYNAANGNPCGYPTGVGVGGQAVGVNPGYNTAYNPGYYSGYNTGYNPAYNTGYNNTYLNNNTITAPNSGCYTAPSNFVGNGYNFNVIGNYNNNPNYVWPYYWNGYSATYVGPSVSYYPRVNFYGYGASAGYLGGYATGGYVAGGYVAGGYAGGYVGGYLYAGGGYTFGGFVRGY